MNIIRLKSIEMNMMKLCQYFKCIKPMSWGVHYNYKLHSENYGTIFFKNKKNVQYKFLRSEFMIHEDNNNSKSFEFSISLCPFLILGVGIFIAVKGTFPHESNYKRKEKFAA